MVLCKIKVHDFGLALRIGRHPFLLDALVEYLAALFRSVELDPRGGQLALFVRGRIELKILFWVNFQLPESVGSLAPI